MKKSSFLCSERAFVATFAFLCFSCFMNALDQQSVKNAHVQGGTVNGGLHVASGIERFFGKDHTNSILVLLKSGRWF